MSEQHRCLVFYGYESSSDSEEDDEDIKCTGFEKTCESKACACRLVNYEICDYCIKKNYDHYSSD